MNDSTINKHAKNTHYLLVYGTLRADCGSDAHKKYLHDTDFISLAKTRGQLYMVNDYPGLVLSDAEHWVAGEMYLLKNETQFHNCDTYEGCAKKLPQPHEYERRIITATLHGGEQVTAWAYIYQQDVSHLTLIDSGDFLNRY